MDQNRIVSIKSVLDSIRGNGEVFRFEIFKGNKSPDGKVHKLKPVGAAYLRTGMKTYTIRLKTFLKDNFYLLPNSRPETKSDFVILTREPAHHSGRKYFWNNVGEGKILDGSNRGFMCLTWDIFDCELFMGLHPTSVNNATETIKANAS